MQGICKQIFQNERKEKSKIFYKCAFHFLKKVEYFHFFLNLFYLEKRKKFYSYTYF